MYWTFGSPGGGIRRANLDGTNVETIYVTDTGDVNPWRIAVDAPGGKMYWAEPRALKIRRANLDGTVVEDVVTTQEPLAPWAIALDLRSRKIYWTLVDFLGGEAPGKIQRASVDGANVEDLVTLGPDQQPADIAVDPHGAKMYWIQYSLQPRQIRRADLDGSDVEDFITTDAGGIALDLPAPIPALSECGVLTVFVSLLTLGSLLIRRNRVVRAHGKTALLMVTLGVLEFAGGERVWTTFRGHRHAGCRLRPV